MAESRHGAGDDEMAALAVPAPLLAHALRTPLNILGGYAALLAQGGLGALEPEARLAAVAMREAAADLDRTVALLEPMCPPPLDQPAQPAMVPLAPLVVRAARGRGWTKPKAVGFKFEGVAWSGWAGLWDALIAAAAPPGAQELVVRVEASSVFIETTPAAFGSGDDRLPGHVATTRAEAAGMTVGRSTSGSWQLQGAGLLVGTGALGLRRVAPVSAQCASC